MTSINTKLLYDEDGYCRLCSTKDGVHRDDCPGSIFDRLRYEVSFSGRHCGRGCCGGGDGTRTGSDLSQVVRNAAEALVSYDFHAYYVNARMVVDRPIYVDSEVSEEMERIRAAKKAEEEAEEEAEEARENLRSNTEAFTYAVQSLEEERGDLTPEAYTRRMRELRERYAALGVVFSDPVVVTVEDDPMPPRTPEEIETFRKDEEARGNFAVPPWEERERAWHARRNRA